MKRRIFIAGLGAAAVFVSRAAHAQQTARPRRIAILMGVREGDPEGIGRYSALQRGLAERGWIDGTTAKLEAYWAGGNVPPTLLATADEVIE